MSPTRSADVRNQKQPHQPGRTRLLSLPPLWPVGAGVHERTWLQVWVLWTFVTVVLQVPRTHTSELLPQFLLHSARNLFMVPCVHTGFNCKRSDMKVLTGRGRRLVTFDPREGKTNPPLWNLVLFCGRCGGLTAAGRTCCTGALWSNHTKTRTGPTKTRTRPMNMNPPDSAEKKLNKE